jgi:hypothetical protein
MANQMIALQARNPQLPDPARATTQMANMINLASQQRAAQLQGERLRQEMDFARAGEAREVELQAPRLAKAQAEATGMDLKTGAEFNAFVYTALKNADSPDQVVGFAQRIASLPQFQNPLYQGMLSDAVENMPTDPAMFQPWKEASASKALTAAEELSNEFTTQNLGTSTRVIRTPKYGRGPAEVVEGSEAAVDIKPTVVNVDNVGPVIVDPNTGKGYAVGAGAPGGYAAPGAGGPRGVAGGEPAKGGPVAKALQTNPGALKDGPFARSQPGYTGKSGGFATFKTPEDGVRAQENLLRTAYVGKGFNTIDKIINRYAPQGPENSAASVSNYKKYVARKAGVDINAPISPAQIPVVAQAMREFETGNTSGGGRGTAGAGTGAPTLSIGEAAKLPSKKRVSSLVSDMIDEYTALNNAKAIGSTERGIGENIFDYLSTGAVGKEVQKAFGTKASASLSNIESIRKLLTTAIKNATGMSQKEMDSNTELQLTLNSLSDATQGYEAVIRILKRIDREYGLGGAGAGAGAPTTGGSQGKRKPSLDSFRRK